jgi:hypothetical protein
MPDTAAHAFAYEHLGYYLDDGPHDPARLMKALTRRHPIASHGSAESRPGSKVKTRGDIRLGSVGDRAHMAVITAGATTLKADIHPARPLPDRVVFRPVTWRTTPAWRAELLRAPPAEPFMVIIFDKATDYGETLRLSSSDLLFECGPQPRMINLAQVRRGLIAFNAAEPKILFEAKQLIDLRLRHPAAIKAADRRLAALRELVPDLFGLCDEFPDVNTAEFDALRLVDNVETKMARAA